MTDSFNIVTGVLLGGILIPFLLINHLDYVVWMSEDLMKENCFPKKANTWYLKENIMDSDYADDLVLQKKTEFMCSKQDGAISTLNGKILKLVDHFS